MATDASDMSEFTDGPWEEAKQVGRDYLRASGEFWQDGVNNTRDYGVLGAIGTVAKKSLDGSAFLANQALVPFIGQRGVDFVTGKNNPAPASAPASAPAPAPRSALQTVSKASNTGSRPLPPPSLTSVSPAPAGNTGREPVLSSVPTQGTFNVLGGRFSGPGTPPAATPEPATPRVRVHNPGIRDLRKELEALSEMIVSGRGANGQPLTADGMRALVGRANNLTSSITGVYGNDLATMASTARDQNNFAGRYLDNQGAFDRTTNQGLFNIAEQIASGAPLWNRARAEAVTQEINRQALPESDVVPYDPTLGSDVGPNMLYQFRVAGQDMANSYLANTNGNPQQARAAMYADLQRLGVDDPYTHQPQDSDSELIVPLMFALRDIEGRMSKTWEVQRFADGGLVGAMLTPELGAPPNISATSISNYQRYVSMAKQMGVNPISFEEFIQMEPATVAAQGAAPGMPEMQPNAAAAGVLGMANGGEVPPAGIASLSPQVDGKMVVDSNPNAPTDSIPALIDGQQPAALDSGEFVLPEDVVRFYGTEKLNKLIEKARGGPQQSAQETPNG